MRIPYPSSNAHKLGHEIYRHGGRSYTACADALVLFGMQRASTEAVIKRMRDELQLELIEGVYQLSKPFREYFLLLEGQPVEKGDAVPPREAPTFRPWTGKYDFAANLRLNRESHCINGGTSPESFRGMKL